MPIARSVQASGASRKPTLGAGVMRGLLMMRKILASEDGTEHRGDLGAAMSWIERMGDWRKYLDEPHEGDGGSTP